MRSRVAMATAVSRGLTVVVGVLTLVLAGAGAAGAATRVDAAIVVRDSMDVGLAGTVGVVAVFVGAVGMVYGLARRRREVLARKARERAATGPTTSAQ
ncbi:MAG TPA: hypothetical protein VFX16_08380 [Pseudonocardiaceae bacterium]|nr:hypothetical protein [Pseudonocardiaceae bacterium]